MEPSRRSNECHHSRNQKASSRFAFRLRARALTMRWRATILSDKVAVVDEALHALDRQGCGRKLTRQFHARDRQGQLRLSSRDSLSEQLRARDVLAAHTLVQHNVQGSPCGSQPFTQHSSNQHAPLDPKSRLRFLTLCGLEHDDGAWQGSHG